MTKQLDFTFKIDGFFHSVNYYRSETPMNPSAMPVATDTGISDLNYSDATAEAGVNYYVRFGSVRGDVEKISDEIVARIELPSVAPELRGSKVSYTTSDVTSFNADLPAGIVAGDLIILIMHRLSTNYASIPSGYFALGSGGSYNNTTFMHSTYVVAKVASGSEGVVQSIAATVAGPFMITAMVFKKGTFSVPRGMAFSYSYVSSYKTRISGGMGSMFSNTGAVANHDEFYPAWRGVNSALISVLNRRYSVGDMAGPYSDFSIRVSDDSTGLPESFVNGKITDFTEPALPLLPVQYTKPYGASDYSNVLNMAIRGVFEPVSPECYPVNISGTDNVAATSTTVTRNTVTVAPLANELEIAILQMYGASGVAITPPTGAGWVLVQKFGSRLAVYKRIAIGSEATSETWNFSSSIVCMISIFAFKAGSFDPSGAVLAQFVQQNTGSRTYNFPAVVGDSSWENKKNYVLHSLVRDGNAGSAAGNPLTFPSHAPEIRNFIFTQGSAGSQVSYVNCGGMISTKDSPAGTMTSSGGYAYESCSIFVKGI